MYGKLMKKKQSKNIKPMSRAEAEEYWDKVLEELNAEEKRNSLELKRIYEEEGREAYWAAYKRLKGL
jgi:hypothetical protein